VPRVLNPDPRPLHDPEWRDVFGLGDEQGVPGQIAAVEAPVDSHRPTQKARAARASFKVLHRLERAQQDG
jgi:hypothetical protein